MAHLIVVYWRDIPAQVIAENGRGREKKKAKIQLPRRFAIAIDEAAMRGGAKSTDDYLADWRRSKPVSCGEDIAAEAQAEATKILEDYTVERVRKLVENGGNELITDK